MMKQLTQRGFTLIELLVVIAIIGILAGVVLTSLNSARSNASDARIQQQMATLRNQAELHFNVGKTYNGLESSQLTQALRDDMNISWGVRDANGWVASAPLSGTNRHYCVDSTGKATTTSSAIAGTATTCP